MAERQEGRSALRRGLHVLLPVLVALVVLQGLYILRERAASRPPLAPPGSATPPSAPPPGVRPGEARPRPFSQAAPDDYDFKEYMDAILEMEKASPSLTPLQAEQILQLFLGALPDLRESRDLYAASAEILTEEQRTFLDLEMDFYKPPTRPEREAFYERLKGVAGVREVEKIAYDPAIVRRRKSIPYLDLLEAHFDRLQQDQRLRISPEQARRLLPYFRYFLEADLCSTTDTCLGKILTAAQREKVADLMVALGRAPRDRRDVEKRFVAHLRSLVAAGVEAAGGTPGGSSSGTP